ncbi:MAG: type III-A CRISPR-associated protein Cas10/Csm1 [Actinobacteria bacterium]|nr:type III-A CRISPR-associated protein Cas10/Csm1 [Actinomycetota bacterium]
MNGGGERLDDLALVRLLALMQAVRALASRTGGSLADVHVADGAAPAVRDAVAGALARDAVATATPQDLEALAVRTAWRLADLGSPGAGRDGTPQVRAILGRVAGPETSDREHVGPADARFVPLKPLGNYGRDALFPGKALAAGDLAVSLRATWKGFTDDHRALPATSLEGYLDSLAAALQKHAWCVPAIPVGTGPRDDRERGSNDVSIADHARVAAAIATALHVEASAGTLDLGAIAANGGQGATPCLALVGGDVSGVQRYLYTITSRRALRGLRGRSFYLQLLGEAVVRHLREALGLPPTSVLLEGGGHFYLLAPLSAVTDCQLATAVGEVSAILLRHHGADLGVAVAHVSLSLNDLSGSGLTKAWRDLGRGLAVAKGRKGGALGPDTLVRDLFTPVKSEGLTHHFCATCQSLIADAPPEAPDPDDDRGRYADYINCARCQGMEDLGDRLRLGTTLVAWSARPEDDPDPEDANPPVWRSQRWRRILRDFGMDAVVVGGRHRRTNDDMPPLGARVTAWRLGDADLVSAKADALRFSDRDVAVGFRLLAQATPMVTDANSWDGSRVAELGELAQAGAGVARLGFLRADVDNLGGVIQKGLRRGPGANDDGGTLARRVALSQSLRLFFEGHLGTICAPRNPVAKALREERDPGTASRIGDKDDRTEKHPKDRLYLIYSGGDDLFLAGAWDAVAETAAEVADALGKYVGGNPAIHLSAGLAVVHDKYPVRQAAEDAGEALDDAKALPAGTGADEPAKNAIAAFGEVVPWAAFRNAQALGARLRSAVRPRAGASNGGRDDDEAEGNRAPRQVIRLALRLCAMEAQAREVIERRKADQARARDERGDPPATESLDVFRPNRRERQVAWGSWMWLGQYALARMQKDGRVPADLVRPEGDREPVPDGTTIAERMLTPEGMATLRIGATWADLAIRKREMRGQGER